MARKTLSVSGMACNGCEQNVESALEALEGVREVEADHETETVELDIEESVDAAEIDAAIEEAGYEVVG
jgi:copper chaperone